MAAEQTVSALRAQIHRLERRRGDVTTLPVSPALQSLFPDGGLRRGTFYAVPESTALLLALLAESSHGGEWTAAIGFPRIGVEAAQHYGIDLDRFVLIPHPGQHWFPVVSALIDVFPLIALRTPETPSPRSRERLAARLRERGAVLLVAEDWESSEASLRVDTSLWQGLDSGYGILRERAVTVTASGRRLGRPRRAHLRLPDPSGRAARAATTLPRPVVLRS